MTRQVHEMGAASYGLQGHITSLNPIRPANAADLWETEALKAFEQGTMEVSSVEKIDEEEYMRLMRPLPTEQSCLKCHAEQGYKIGDLRGGISVSVPMSPLHAIARGHMATLALGHSLLWLLGITGITIGGQHLKKRMLERYRAGEALLESEQRFRDFFENAPIGFHVFGSDQIIIDINDAELEMIGYSKKAIVGKKTWAELIVPQQRDMFKKHWHDITTKGHVRNLEYTLVHKDGHHIDVILNASARFDKDGNIVNTRGSVLNITVRKQAEEQIQTLSRFPSENPNPILRISAEGVLLYANQSSSKLLAFWEIAEKEYVNTEIYDIVADALASRQNKQIDVECAECIFSLTFAPVAEMNYVNVYALDITERILAERALSESEEEYRTFIESSNDFIFSKDVHGRYQTLNLKTAIGLGATCIEDVIGKTDYELLPKEQADAIQKIDRQIMDSGKDIETEEVVGIGENKAYALSHKWPRCDKQGKISGIRCFGMDITERKKVQEALKEERDFSKNLIEVAQTIILVLDTEGRIVSFNPYMEELSGYKLNEVKGKDWFTTFLPECDYDKIRKLFREAIENIQTKGDINPIISKDGQEIFVEWYDKTLKDRDGKTIGLLTIGLDITERKKAEEELKRQRYYLEKAQDIGSIGTWELDIKNNKLVWTDENYRIFGIPIGTELTYEIFLNCIHPDDREYVDKKWKAALNNEPYDIEHRLLVDGNVKWVREKAELELDEKGNCVRGIGFTQDTTRRKQAEIALRKANDELEERVQERTKELARNVEILHREVADRKRLEKEVLTISEEEQRRIGRELHDGLQQELVGTTFNCERLRRKLAAKSLPEAEEAARIHHLLKDSIDHARDITRMLYPIDIESKELTLALGQLATRVEHLFRISCPFKCNRAIFVENPEMAINIYRIAQEAITNAIKHGKADHISISLDTNADIMTLAVKDNGVGLAADHADTEGMGLRIMKYRASLINASLDISPNAEGPGTSVICSFETKDNK
jgi:PAS domain S-box-containing protein